VIFRFVITSPDQNELSSIRICTARASGYFLPSVLVERMLTHSSPRYNDLYFHCFSQHLLYEYIKVYFCIFLSFCGFLVSKKQYLFLFSVWDNFCLSQQKWYHDTLKMMFNWNGMQ